MTQLEICINADDLHSLEANVAAALQGGASRIELCADMQQQGMTPTVLAMQKARHAFATAPGLLVMVRFRSDDQVQTKADLASMQLAIAQAADAGANGVVLGLLNQQRGLDLPSLDLLVSQAKKLGLQVLGHDGVLLLSPGAPSFPRYRDYAERGRHFAKAAGFDPDLINTIPGLGVA